MSRNQYQPKPQTNEKPAIWQELIREYGTDPETPKTLLTDMAERDLFGRSKYGTPLQPFNGRDPIVDAYQEALDLVVYTKQAILEGIDAQGIHQMAWTCTLTLHNLIIRRQNASTVQ